MTYRVAPWCAGANMNPKPTSSRQRPTCSGVRSIRTPSASRTSADPDSPVAVRLPCLAIAQPAPAAMSAAVVETLNDGRPPPVPAVSTRSARDVVTGRGELAHRAREAGDLLLRLALRAQADEQTRDLRLLGVAGHDHGEDVGRLLAREVRAGGDGVEALRVRTSLHALGQEVAQHRGALRRQDGLRMELDALRGQLAVADRP